MEKYDEAMRCWPVMLFVSMQKTSSQARDFFVLPLDRRAASR
jgi:hypothetical protein